MNLELKSPAQVINRSYRREKVHPQTFEQFTNALDNYFYYTNRAKEQDETEENLKKYIGNLLQSFFPNHYQNTKSYKGNHAADWVIATPNEEQPKVQILLEIKKSDNKSEMITADNLNRKALQELVTYYLWERIEYDNNEIKYLIISNIEEYFIFDATDFHRLFYKNMALVKQFNNWKAGKLDSTSTDEMYKFIKKMIANSEEILTAIHFNIYDYQSDLEALKTEDLHQKAVFRLSEIYKIFAPKFLLKEKIDNDSNELNKEFYYELLHILGLEEQSDGAKKTIVRCKEPNVGSLLENTIVKLRTEDLLYNLRRPNEYGETDKERYFNVSLDLVITWLNRILFLKLLEAQLVAYNIEDTDKDEFRFLHSSKVTEFDAINTLFFEVLALPEKEREKHITKEYGRIPYLNSSLFEITNLERQTLRISNIKDSTTLPLYEKTILKTADGKRFPNDGTTELPTLQYLLDFLEAYDFGLESTDSVLKSATKPLINAAVLGLIFEKLNGYKEGAFFTPGFITMYMSSETLRRVVVDKFNDTKNGFGIAADSFEDVRNYCQNLYKVEDYKKANDIINSITVCDPSVGSGHFLVSVLNELLAIKSELGILCDLEGKPLKREMQLKIENDELVVYDNMGVPFVYKVSFADGFRKLIPNLQRIQETIFHEKKYLIEHSLFGVDINPNSVKICRLRLWIELLKNAYYRQRRNTQLETLPNIDINIKTGNSLISRFALNTDLNDVFKRTEYSIEEYKRTVKAYKTEENKGQKRQLSHYLEDIKAEFQVTFNKREKEKIAKIRGRKDSLELQIRYNKNLGYEPRKKELEDLQKYTVSLQKKETEREQILASEIYHNAFEWRFEFPEVLDENGAFVGFDVVIGNPPYIRSREKFEIAEKNYFNKKFQVTSYQIDLYKLFIELGTTIKSDIGLVSFITPSVFLGNDYDKTLRKFLLENYDLKSILDAGENVFDEASVKTIVFLIGNLSNNNQIQFYKLDKEKPLKTVKIPQHNFIGENYIINQTFTPEIKSFLNKINEQSVKLEELFEVKNGIKIRKNLILKEPLNNECYPFLLGKNIKPFYFDINNEMFIHYTKENEQMYSNQAFRTKEIFEVEKIIIRQIPTNQIVSMFDNSFYFTDQTTYVVYKQETTIYNLLFLQGLLSSKLMAFYFFKFMSDGKKVFPKIKRSQILRLPILKKPNLHLHDQIVQKVEEILAIKKVDSEANTETIEVEIDALVFELYDLTDAEIALIHSERPDRF